MLCLGTRTVQNTHSLSAESVHTYRECNLKTSYRSAELEAQWSRGGGGGWRVAADENDDLNWIDPDCVASALYCCFSSAAYAFIWEVFSQTGSLDRPGFHCVTGH